jgi:hypothetical protein
MKLLSVIAHLKRVDIPLSELDRPPEIDEVHRRHLMHNREGTLRQSVKYEPRPAYPVAFSFAASP